MNNKPFVVVLGLCRTQDAVRWADRAVVHPGEAVPGILSDEERRSELVRESTRQLRSSDFDLS